MTSISATDNSLARRIAQLDWPGFAEAIGARGYAKTEPLLTAAECTSLIRLYGQDARFRKTIDMGRHSYGEGEYRYFDRPLPALVQRLRTALYARLAPIANAMMADMARPYRYPDRLADFLKYCHAEGQMRPTPLLLRYREGGYNCLHRDLYGPVLFPLQAAICLSRAGRDFDGGAFLLLEQRPRMQSRGEAITLDQGEIILFPTAERPVAGRRGFYRTSMRHGVSRLTRGERHTLGIIFHDAT